MLIDSLFLNALPVLMLATVFFFDFRRGFIDQIGPGGLPRWTPNMDLSWTSFWEASWNDFGKVFGSQDGLKKAQDGAKTVKMVSILGSIFGCMLSAILGGCLGASWGRLGGVLGRLGASWAHLFWFGMCF